MLIRTLGILVSLLLIYTPANAEKTVFLIGGGPNLNDTQASIEINSRWVRQVIQYNVPDGNFYTFFSDGDPETLDARGWRRVEDTNASLQPLARVFDWHVENGYFYYRSSLITDSRPAVAEEIQRQLRKALAKMKPADDLILVFQGHGGYDSDDTLKNSLLLRGNSQITVKDFLTELEDQPPGVTTRFVFPQCFSGAFARLIYKNGRFESGLASQTRCGFLAQDAHLEAEGCTSSINTDDYRDYTNYFVAALDGKHRGGKKLAFNPDRNGDNIVSLREAHIYTLINAESIDYSRSTSEDYLEQWEPWYLIWLPEPKGEDNIYTWITRQLLQKQGIQESGSGLKRGIDTRLSDLIRLQHGSKNQRRAVINDIDRYQQEIRAALTGLWPALRTPYTAQFRQILLNNLDDVQDFILQHPSYQALVDAQRWLSVLDARILAQQRQAVQLKKILRMQHLARLYTQFQKIASPRDKQNYHALLRCEERPL